MEKWTVLSRLERKRSRKNSWKSEEEIELNAYAHPCGALSGIYDI